jgi:hypothetical protein
MPNIRATLNFKSIMAHNFTSRPIINLHEIILNSADLTYLDDAHERLTN